MDPSAVSALASLLCRKRAHSWVAGGEALDPELNTAFCFLTFPQIRLLNWSSCSFFFFFFYPIFWWGKSRGYTLPLWEAALISQRGKRPSRLSAPHWQKTRAHTVPLLANPGGSCSIKHKIEDDPVFCSLRFWQPWLTQGAELSFFHYIVEIVFWLHQFLQQPRGGGEHHPAFPSVIPAVEHGVQDIYSNPADLCNIALINKVGQGHPWAFYHLIVRWRGDDCKSNEDFSAISNRLFFLEMRKTAWPRTWCYIHLRFSHMPFPAFIWEHCLKTHHLKSKRSHFRRLWVLRMQDGLPRSHSRDTPPVATATNWLGLLLQEVPQQQLVFKIKVKRFTKNLDWGAASWEKAASHLGTDSLTLPQCWGVRQGQGWGRSISQP